MGSVFSNSQLKTTLNMKFILVILFMLLIAFEPAFSGKILKKLDKELKKMGLQKLQIFLAEIGTNADEIDSNKAHIGTNAVDIGGNKVDVANNLANITKNAMDIASHLSSHELGCNDYEILNENERNHQFKTPSGTWWCDKTGVSSKKSPQW